MAYRVRLTSLAESDAYSAYDYIRERSPESADKWLVKLFRAILSLDQMPSRCSVIPEADELGYPARQLIYGKRSAAYRIIFDIQEESEEGARVRILRIWRGSRDHLTRIDIETDLPDS